MSKSSRRTYNTTYKDSKFVALQRKWYAKLKVKGFVDLELLKDNGDTTTHLLRGSIYSFKTKFKPETEYYFRKARFYLHRAKFSNKLEKQIWEMHSDGYSLHYIYRNTKCGMWTVRKVVAKHREAMLKSTEFENIEALYVTKGLGEFERGVRQNNREKARLRKSANSKGRSNALNSRSNRPRPFSGEDGDGET